MTGFYKDYADASDTHQNSAEASATAAEQSATAAASSATAAEQSANAAAASLLAQEDLEVTSASFDTTDGTFTLTRANGGTVTTDFDGRYVETSGATFTGEVFVNNHLVVSAGYAMRANLLKSNESLELRYDADNTDNTSSFVIRKDNSMVPLLGINSSDNVLINPPIAGINSRNANKLGIGDLDDTGTNTFSESIDATLGIKADQNNHGIAIQEKDSALTYKLSIIDDEFVIGTGSGINRRDFLAINPTNNGTMGAFNIVASQTLTASGITYPTTDGTSNQVIVTDGNGNLSFADQSGGGIGSSGGTFTGDVTFSDDTILKFGNSDTTVGDLTIHHDSTTTSSFIKERNTNGSFYIQGETLYLTDINSEKYLMGVSGGGTTLYYDGDDKLNTNANGISVQGNISLTGTVDGVHLNEAVGQVLLKANKAGDTFTGDMLFDDDVKAKFGEDSDLQIYHVDGGNSIIDETGEGALVLRTNGSAFAVVSDDNEYMINATVDGGVALYHDGSVRLSTSSNTVQVSSFPTVDVNFVVDTDTLYVDSANDRVGINTTTPSEALDVNGNITTSGGLTVEGVISEADFVGDVVVKQYPTLSDLLTTSRTPEELANWSRYLSSAGPTDYDNADANYRDALDVNEDEDFSSADSSALTSFVSANYNETDESTYTNIVNGTNPDDSTFVTDVYNGLYNTGALFGTNLTNNRVGINTGNPSETLDVNGNIAVSGTVDGVDIASLNTTVAGKADLTGATFTGDVVINGETDFNDPVTFNSDASGSGSYDLIATFNARDSASTFEEAGRIGTLGQSFPPSRLLIGQGSAGITFYDFMGGRQIQPVNVTTGATTDAVVDLGGYSARFKLGRFSSGTTTSSDRNEKRDIEELTEAELRVAERCKPLLRKYRRIDAYEEKGEDARIHFGIIAQDLDDAFTAEGLDAHRYAMFMEDTWYETEEGGHTYTSLDEIPEDLRSTAVEKTRMGVRYEQLLAFIIAAI